MTPCIGYILEKVSSVNTKVSFLIIGLSFYILLTERRLYKQNKKIKELSEKE